MKLLLPFLYLFLTAFTGLAAQPNVIVIVTDDQGYGDMSCHGNPVLKTPHIDSLHAQSLRLTDFHVAPMCTPTRGQLLTGIDAAANGAINVSSGRTLLKTGIPTLADILSGNGYQTGLFGKWHLGDNYPYRPEDRGFQETLWFPSSHINSTPDVWDNDYFDDTYRRNGTLKKYQGYCTDIFFDEAMTWMKKQADEEKPFFVYLPTNAPHSPYWLPQHYRDAMTADLEEAERSGRLKTKLTGDKRTRLIDFLAMIQQIDDNIGKLDSFLTESGIGSDTIVIFLTDNGSTLGETYFNAGMRGRKTQLWEGGHRVPCFVRWPGGKLGEPRDISGLTQVQDLAPTILDLCEIKTESKFDGESLEAVLRKRETVDEDRILTINYSRMPFGFDYPSPDSPSIMRREGAGVLWKQWRLLEDRELYNLETDPRQKTNVIEDHPEVVAKMRNHLNQWWERVGPTANDPQPVIIGHEEANPAMLTACEWLDVFIDQQSQIRRADLKNGWWELEVADAGRYEFELRRWPRELDLGLSEGLPATRVTDGTLLEGTALPIGRARLKLGTGPMMRRPLKPKAKFATFSANLEPGRIRLHTWFDDNNGQPLLGAYYVYVERK
ncbi:MAG: arylsulfatase [Verrucomicrobiales bacterium]|nr:arylsulfatase [Verrucomicrobiales bacterium]